ncbi:Toxin VapC4 [Stieleria neptunia]|uniref:Toxin VapC4 n=1 Tax=Stieleria neptunia TaxID=2527979 RepID=A0A518HMZ1_9BACT|nr:PIN domain-containing protein [Stieleria neptunia]QDV42222.1 Toxin VapC4 [Stieleria neptunia]
MKFAVIDTDVVSFAFRGDDRYSFYRPVVESTVPMISFMTYAEMRHGALNRNWGERRTNELLTFIENHFAIIQSDKSMADAWAMLRDAATRAGRVLRTADGWVAAAAVSRDIPLVSNNEKDFGYLPNLTLITDPAKRP